MNKIDLTETHHCVDDISPAIYAMSEFVNYGMFSVMNCHHEEDGRSMNYRLLDPERMGAYMKRARLIITIFHLPLEVEPEYQVGEFGIRAFLKVKYTGR